MRPSRSADVPVVRPSTAVLPFDLATESAARVRYTQESAVLRTSPYDLLIAGHARSASLDVVSNHLREFARLPALRLVDWRA